MKILFLTSNFVPPFSGDSIFSLGLAVRLAKKHQPTLISFGEQKDWDESPAAAFIKDYHLIKRESTRYNKAVQIVKYGSLLQMHDDEYLNTLKSVLKNQTFDYIVIDHLRTYSMYKAAKKLVDRTKTKLIYMAHNIEFKNHQQKLKNFPTARKRLYYNLINRNIRKLEIELINEADIVWGLSQKDIDELSEVATIKHSQIIPPYFPWTEVKPKASLEQQTKKIMILGSMQWYPNVQGALHFIKDIFPKILEQDPSYQLLIVGQKPDQRLLDAQSDKIIVTGRVPSVDPYVRDADLLVIPNRFGSGIKIKLLESIIKGLPVILYKENVDGYEKGGFNYPFVVDSSEQFVKSILMVNNDVALKQSFIEKHTKQFIIYRDFDFQL